MVLSFYPGPWLPSKLVRTTNVWMPNSRHGSIVAGILAAEAQPDPKALIVALQNENAQLKQQLTVDQEQERYWAGQALYARADADHLRGQLANC